MFGWRKREQGFEWHQYVRTTIKLRRDARREKADQIKQQAADGVKAAGAAAASGVKVAGAAAADGLKAARMAAAEGAKVAGEVAGSAARQGAQKLGAGSRVAAQGLGRGARQAASAIGPRVDAVLVRAIAALQPLLQVISRRNVQAPLIVFGGLLAVGGILRSVILRSSDAEATTAVAVGGVCLVMALLPRLLLATAPPFPAWLQRLSHRPAIAATLLCGVVAVSLMKVWPGTASFSMGSITRLPFAQPKDILQGRVTAVAGDILRIGAQGIRLADIEFPDREQTCQRSAKRNGTWRCGEAALATFARLTSGHTLSCEVQSRDDQGIANAICSTGATVINEELVRSGAAFATAGFLARYSSIESDAQARKVGFWSGDVLRPSEWRQAKWDEALRRGAPGGCPIKGQNSGNARVYVLPWASQYDRIQINTRRGDRWFCSEDEAKSAGWKIAGR